MAKIIGLEEIDDGLWTTYFVDVPMARMNQGTKTVEPAPERGGNTWISDPAACQVTRTGVRVMDELVTHVLEIRFVTYVLDRTRRESARISLILPLRIRVIRRHNGPAS